jgi:Flp pilus assembly protein TadD
MLISRRTLVLLAGVLCGTVFGGADAHADEAASVRSLLQAGDAGAALARAEAALKALPRDAHLRFLAAVALMELHRDAAAMEVFVALTQDYPELPDPYNNIALLDVRAGRLARAEDMLRTALRNDPAHRAARLNLGQVHLMQAVEAWRRAADEGPANPALQAKLEAAQALLGQPMIESR